MTARVLLCATGFLIAEFASGANGGSSLRSLAQADRDFAASALENGARYAYLFYLAPDAVGFEPGPVPLHERWLERLPQKMVLTMTTTRAQINAAGNFGWTTGPWLQESRFTGTKAFGDFVTLWKYRPGDGWRIALQAGTTHEAPREDMPALRVSHLSTHEGRAAVGDLAAFAKVIDHCDDEYAAAILSRGFGATAASYGARDLVTLILGQPTAYTRKSAVEVRAPFVTPGAQQRAFTGAGGSADLGFTYGTIAFAAPGAQYYLRVWRVRHGQCELELEWLRPR
ncbi:MAG: hypothetical protein ACRETU_01535 [Steroidobacterales bacterium]